MIPADSIICNSGLKLSDEVALLRRNQAIFENMPDVGIINFSTPSDYSLSFEDTNFRRVPIIQTTQHRMKNGLLRFTTEDETGGAYGLTTIDETQYVPFDIFGEICVWTNLGDDLLFRIELAEYDPETEQYTSNLYSIRNIVLSMPRLSNGEKYTPVLSHARYAMPFFMRGMSLSYDKTYYMLIAVESPTGRTNPIQLNIGGIILTGRSY